jgi:flagellar assembly protein FliH
MSSAINPNGQASYSPTAYADEHWEIVGEFHEEQFFIPDQFQVVGASSLTTDPMFANYGGLPESSDTRLHAPIDAQGKQKSEVRYRGLEKAATEEDNRIKLTQQELEQKLEAAKQEGKFEALEESVLRHQEQLEKLQTQINIILQDMDKQVSEKVATIENQALNLALEISRLLVRGAVEINPEYILPLISEAIDKVGTASIKRVRISPEDMEFINIVGVEKQLKEFDGSWVFEADGTIRSGCIVDTSAGEIDFQLEPAWERVKDKIIRVGVSDE